MNFELTEDEEMLKAVVERFVADHYDVEKRRKYLKEPGGFSGGNWGVLAELGLLAVPFAEDDGGLGLDATALSVVFQALGRGMVVEPVLESAILPGLYLAHGLSGDLREQWVTGVLSGERRVALARQDAGLYQDDQTVRAKDAEDGAVLNGQRPFAIAGGEADGFIVGAEDGSLYLVPADAAGLEIREWRLADGTHTASLEFADVAVPAAHRLDIAPEVAARIETLAALARASEGLGIMDAMFDETLGYLRTREQFGTQIGKFQAIQHRMAALYATLEQCRALVETAIVAEGTDRFADDTYGARAFIAQHSLTLGHEMIQMHGGMGITDELSIGQGHKRLLVLSRWPEPPLATLDRYAAAL
ncbi:acyl-CoA dehydrogenase family protein [Croceicoccus marinus]|uniref:Acyl-CoA dehydrogenase n=1 Tax=Croceicoccus marinus TaxID=450378 RepID=A0A1Z1FGJ1_9SPHN|nr:acyl-CoA dehydrogenase family protein [Croceicoccus marinus]ARU17929.1 acyl-CoA dehydrogenase [Croceicoccus marinus]QNE07436.1 acyl-CoA dehydrogenase family protein [Croceicoccus marinus]